MICKLKFQARRQLSVRTLRSKYDLSVKISSHLLVVSKDVEIIT